MSRDRPALPGAGTPLFFYLGRRGGGARIALQVARSIARRDDAWPDMVLSGRNELLPEFDAEGLPATRLTLFDTAPGAVFQGWRIPGLRRRLHGLVATSGAGAAIELMPHPWSPLLAPAIRAAGARYIPVIHDAVTHPGDLRSRIIVALRAALLRRADAAICLSDAVAEAVQSQAPGVPVHRLFHPDLAPATAAAPRRLDPARPPRLLFFGRIIRYKGLDLLLDAAERLRAEGIRPRIGVFGSGPLGAAAERLRAFGPEAEVENRWIAEAEVPAILARYDIMALPYIEASQSGVVALASGFGLPVVATPVGGLPEQIGDGTGGVIAAAATPEAFAAAVGRLLHTPGLYDTIAARLAAGGGDDRSAARFVELCRQLAA